MLSANDIAELEKKYSKYIFRKRLKLIFIATIFLSITIFALYYLLYSPKIQKKVIDVNKTVKNVIKDRNITKLKKIVAIKKENNTTKNIKKPKKNISNIIKKVIKPDINTSDENKLIFHIKPQNIIVGYAKSARVLKLNRYFLNKKYKFKKQKSINAIKNINKNDIIQKEKYIKPKIHIEMRNINTIQYLKEKFQKTHDIVVALMLCRNYYSKKKYKESLKWSIIANDINSQNEKSWIWFAKSKYRLNKKKDAIKALKAFMRSNDSKNIRLLLKDIINGELND